MWPDSRPGYILSDWSCAFSALEALQASPSCDVKALTASTAKSWQTQSYVALDRTCGATKENVENMCRAGPGQLYVSASRQYTRTKSCGTKLVSKATAMLFAWTPHLASMSAPYAQASSVIDLCVRGGITKFLRSSSDFKKQGY